MATHDTLTSLFTDIADAIRSKTKGTAKIVADNFPAEIAAIATGVPAASGSFTASSSTSVTISGLGFTTKKLMIIADTYNSDYWQTCKGLYVDFTANVKRWWTPWDCGGGSIIRDTSFTTSRTSDSVTIQKGTNGSFLSGYKYYWIAIG